MATSLTRVILVVFFVPIYLRFIIPTVIVALVSL